MYLLHSPHVSLARVWIVAILGSVISSAAVSHAQTVTGSKATDKQAQSLRRVAVIDDPTLRQAGLLELLTVRLSTQQDVELVERKELERISTELKLSQLLSAEGVGQRVTLGRLLGADVLYV